MKKFSFALSFVIVTFGTISLAICATLKNWQWYHIFLFLGAINIGFPAMLWWDNLLIKLFKGNRKKSNKKIKKEKSTSTDELYQFPITKPKFTFATKIGQA